MHPETPQKTPHRGKNSHERKQMREAVQLKVNSMTLKQLQFHHFHICL